MSKFHTNAGMYALGEKYGIESLKAAAKRKFETALAAGEPVSTTTLGHLIDAIPIIYETTPESDRGLRDLVADFARRHSKAISEGETKRIELYGDDPDYVEMMLRYCYSTDYATNSTALNDAKMYAMGDKYDMQNLKLLAEEKFAVSITKSPDDFIASIVTVYTSTPDSDRGLRGLVAGYAVYHWKKLFSMPDFQKAIAQNLGVVNDIIEGHSLSTTAQIFSEYTRLELPKGIKRKKMRPKSDTGQTEISDLEFGSGTSDGF
ncbi:hypothetical protein P7C71_g3156, partial [Lecanoromycetidae sp. Uapishka_2]